MPISWLNHKPHAIAVYASWPALPSAHATLATGRPATALPGPVLHRLDCTSFCWRLQKVGLKDPAEFKLIGTPHRRLDCAGKVDGSAKFGIDTRLPGMKFAVLAQSPTFGGKLITVDEAKAKAVPGVSQVVKLDDAVAVVASHTFAAKQGLAAANPRWDPGPNAKVSMTDIVDRLDRASEKPGAVALHEGD